MLYRLVAPVAYATTLVVSALSVTGCGSEANPAVRSPVALSGPRTQELSSFEQQDRTNAYAQGGVVFVGSSSIRFWDLDASFPGRDYLNRGFGGSQIADSVMYLELLLLRHAPRVVVLYAGDNDIASGMTPERVATDFKTFANGVHAALPETQILFLAIKPSIARWELVEQMRAANQLIRDECDRDLCLIYVDIDTPMIGSDGLPAPHFFVAGGLHLSAADYALWTQIVVPLLPS